MRRTGRISPASGAQLLHDVDPLGRLQQFLLERVESYEQLEVLLLLVKSRELVWPSAAICKKLQLSEAIVSHALDALRRKGLVMTLGYDQGAFLYAPENAAVDQIVMELARACESQRLEVMKAMTANAIQRLRASAADAFDVVTHRKKPAN
jgi:hypothetical protein